MHYLNYINQFRGLPRQIYYICFSRVIIGIGSMIFTFFSLLLTRILGFSEFHAGLAFLLICVCNIAGAIIGGKLADRYGRKRVYIIAITITSFLYLMTAFVVRTNMMIPFIFATSLIGSAAHPILSAMVADSAPENKRTECFSFVFVSKFRICFWPLYRRAIVFQPYGLALCSAGTHIHDCWLRFVFYNHGRLCAWCS